MGAGKYRKRDEKGCGCDKFAAGKSRVRRDIRGRPHVSDIDLFELEVQQTRATIGPMEYGERPKTTLAELFKNTGEK